MSTMKLKRFELLSADGGPLRGEVRTAGGGEGRPAVVICHGFKGFKDWGFFPKLAEWGRMARPSRSLKGSGTAPTPMTSRICRLSLTLCGAEIWPRSCLLPPTMGFSGTAGAVALRCCMLPNSRG